MQELHTADRAGLAPPRVAYPTLRSTRIRRIARMFLGMPLDMDLDICLGMARDIATGLAMFREIGVGHVAYLYHSESRNSRAEVKSLSNFGSSRWSTISLSREFQ